MAYRSDQTNEEKKKTSFIEEARRRQIVEIAVETIAEVGYHQTTLADIADKAKISKGVIPYYFQNKAVLIQETIRWISLSLHEYTVPRVNNQSGAMDKLRAFITSNYEYMKYHRSYMVAMVDLWGSHKTREQKTAFHEKEYEQDRKWLENIIKVGQENGEIPGLNADNLASLILALIDGVMIQWVFNENTISLDTSCQNALIMVERFVAGEN